jgi:hypothetical protein
MWEAYRLHPPPTNSTCVYLRTTDYYVNERETARWFAARKNALIISNLVILNLAHRYTPSIIYHSVSDPKFADSTYGSHFYYGDCFLCHLLQTTPISVSLLLGPCLPPVSLHAITKRQCIMIRTS